MAAGTLFGIGLSQQNDANGVPMAGCLLYLYLANTSTPVIAYRNTGLSAGQELPNPIVADANGRLPAFWLDAANNYRARLTNAAGIVQFDEANILPIGAVSGGGGGGDTTDPNSVASTGDVKWRPLNQTLAGWVRLNGRTIGSATSGGTERANADCQALFELAWNAFDNTFCPVSGGRGASSIADWNANKTLQLIDMRGRAPFGLDGMGSALAGRLTALGADLILGGADFYGTVGGHEGNQLDITKLPAHQHDAFINEVAHGHPGGTAPATSNAAGFGGVGSAANPSSGPNTTISTTIPTALTGVRVKSTSGGAADDKTANAGGGGTHFNMPPYMLGTWFWRL